MDRSQPDYVEAVRFLYDRINYEKAMDRPYDQQNYRLARMEFLLNQLGNPHLRVPVVHIAGTKGKGSVAWLTSEAIRAAGYRVGLYTSPHLEHLEERFVINGQTVEPSMLVEAIGQIRDASDQTSRSSHGAPTFFELTTALAWLLFADQKTDINVIEVGLGGRLDSTNVCHSMIAIITSISFDHQAQLGNTIALIAGEKAGIIKKGCFVIHGAKHPDAREVIREKARTEGCQFWELGRDFECLFSDKVAPKVFLNEGPDVSSSKRKTLRFDALAKNGSALASMSEIQIRMLGAHQADNAGLAIAACQKLNQLGWVIPEAAIRNAIASTQVTSRIEIVSQEPITIVDSAHNVASISSLVDTLRDSFSPRRKTIVFASSKDKEYEAMLEILMPYTDRLVVTQYANNPRFVPVERLEAIAKGMQSRFPGSQVFSAVSSDVAYDFVQNSYLPDELICYTGSFFLAAEVRPKFRI